MNEAPTEATDPNPVLSENISYVRKTGQRYCICIVCDFFYPRLGGVELHQYQLAQELIARGHRVIIVTGVYGNRYERQGVRYLPSGLKVYYCVRASVHNQVTFPTLLTFLPQFRRICIKEKVDIVHGHQTTSTMAHECLLLAAAMGIRTVFTDHSLFGFANLGAIHVNKLMQFTLSHISHVICVSHTLRENLALRARINPRLISAIPNALDATKFRPDPSRAPNALERVNVIVISRLAYRKGIDIVVDILPRICAAYPTVHFIIGGEGPKRHRLEAVCKAHELTDRVQLLGEVAHADVRGVLTQGHIFLNCSLTESFCIAILEAAACGLHVVATRVGGVPEVLPPSFVEFAEPEADSVAVALARAIEMVIAREQEFQSRHSPAASALSSHGARSNTSNHSQESVSAETSSQQAAVQELKSVDQVIDERQTVPHPATAHEQQAYSRYEAVKRMYNWSDVAWRTNIVYDSVMLQARPHTFLRMVRSYASHGPVSSFVFSFVAALALICVWILDKLDPSSRLEPEIELSWEEMEEQIVKEAEANQN